MRWHEDHSLPYLKLLLELTVLKCNEDDFWARLRRVPPEKIKEEGGEYDGTIVEYGERFPDKEAKIPFENIDPVSEEWVREIGPGAIGFWLMGYESDQDRKADNLQSFISFKHYENDDWKLTEEDIREAERQAEQLSRELGWG